MTALSQVVVREIGMTLLRPVSPRKDLEAIALLAQQEGYRMGLALADRELVRLTEFVGMSQKQRVLLDAAASIRALLEKP